MSGIEIAGLIIAMPAIIQFFFETGEKVLKKMESDKKLKECARDFSKFIEENSKAQLRVDFELAKGVLKDQCIRSDDKDRVARLFNEASERIHRVSDLTDTVLSSEILEFRKRTAALKELKDKIIEIKSSISEFHQLVMSLHTVATSESSLLLEDQDFVLVGTDHDYETLNAALFVARGRTSRPLSGASTEIERFVIESKPYLWHSMRSIKKDLRILSQKLAVAEQHNGILPLLGFRDNPSGSEFQLVFGTPPGIGSPRTLESLYRHGTSTPSLNFRIDLCRQLAEAVLQTHTLGLVHKHIRPENVLLFSAPREGTALDSFAAVFLSGWQYARNVDGGTTRLVGEGLWHRAIYQHPERQNLHADNEYCMGHDIYSLGVCMLEILRWDPFVIIAGEGDLQEVSIAQSYRAIFDRYGLGQASDTQGELSDVERLTQDPNMVKSTLLYMGETLIPAAAGERMRDLVCQCLTCLDSDASLGRFVVSQERDDKDAALGFVDTVLKEIRRVLSSI